jgi:serine/threonine protein kinase
MKSLSNVNVDHKSRGITGLSQVYIDPNVTHLYLSGNPLESLEGLGSLPGLEVLVVDNCRLTSLEGIQALPKMHTLYAKNNHISDITCISSALNVQKLNLSGNPIPDYKPLDGLDNLMILSLDHCGLDQLPDISLPSVRDLSLSGNNLVSLEGIQKYPLILRLDLGGNNLKDTSALAYLEELEELNLSSNGLTGIPPGIPPFVRVLKLNDNKITSIDNLSNLLNLLIIDLSRNPLRDSGLNSLADYLQNNRWARRIKFSVYGCGINWASKDVQACCDRIHSTGMRVNAWPEKLFFDVPGYRKVDLAGEGGTFDVFLLQKEENPINDLYRYISRISTDRQTFRKGMIDYFHQQGIDPLANCFDVFIDGLVKDMPRSEEEIPSFITRLTMTSITMIKEGAEKYKDPDGDYYVMLVPKYMPHSHNPVSISGYRMIKEVGQEQLLERGLESHLMLQGLPGIPEIKEVINVEFRRGLNDIQIQKCLIERYIPGNSLDSFLKEHLLKAQRQDTESIRLIGKYLVKTVDIVGGIHSRGLVHNDVSPNNVHVTPDNVVYVLDYALATSIDFGTVAYASRRFSSPELLTGSSHITPSSDIWSFGPILYTFLKGKHPLGEDSDNVVRIVSDRSQFEQAKRQIDFYGLPEGLRGVIRKTMMYDPYERYQSAAEMKKDLEGAIKYL